MIFIIVNMNPNCFSVTSTLRIYFFALLFLPTGFSVSRLFKNNRFGFDAANAPCQNPITVDHWAMTIGSNKCIQNYSVSFNNPFRKVFRFT